MIDKHMNPIKNNKRLHVIVSGIVQGVGFRPFTRLLADRTKLTGWVRNSGGAVEMEIEGKEDAIDSFMQGLQSSAPPLSRIRAVFAEEVAAEGTEGFRIIPSNSQVSGGIYLSPDIAVCGDCLSEMSDEKNRRYRYPFTNCTNCGPRFTITSRLPYDRNNTTMGRFSMCAACSREYNDPDDRRYHAQPVSCPDCGPVLSLTDASGKDLHVADPIAMAAESLDNGFILALKGIGGYHLFVNAHDSKALQRLRQRKERDAKPMAVMAADIEAAARYCEICDAEIKLIDSWRKPIVLLRKRKDFDLPEEIAPNNSHLGVMLPYTPLHALLFGSLRTDIVIATSANISDEPVYFGDDDAVIGLQGIADNFLMHDREILIRADDSVTRIFDGKEYIIRRSRGYAPEPLTVKIHEAAGSGLAPSVLACGAHMKNTFCINVKDEFFISHHIGDMENAETYESYENAIMHYLDMLKSKPSLVAYDCHPDYYTTKYALAYPAGMRVAVQHHAAHIASCMADNGITGDVIGVAFDGTGYGMDGNLWGGEFFYGGYGGMKRAGHMQYVKMPGGEAAVREPWRMALSYLDKASRLDCADCLEEAAGDRLNPIKRLLDSGFNCPLTSSAGRLFDAVSALIGFSGRGGRIAYEGQAAMELEYLADRVTDVDTDDSMRRFDSKAGRYGYDIDEHGDMFIVKTGGIINGVLGDLKAGAAPGDMALKFHDTMASVVADACLVVKSISGLNKVALSGGVFQNMLLLRKCKKRLELAGFEVYIHHRVPANDAGISFGQAVSALYTDMPMYGNGR